MALVLSAQDLAFELLLTKSILRSLELDQILYVVLSGVTSGEGLGFNRGVFLLADEGGRALRAAMAVGPEGPEEAHRIWEDMVDKDLTLEALLPRYDRLRDDPNAHRLSRRLGGLRLPLDRLDEIAAGYPANPGATVDIRAALARGLLDRARLGSRDIVLTFDPEDGQPPLELENWWIVPLLGPDAVVGALVVDDTFTEREVSPGTQHLLTSLADLTTVGVEKSRLFAKMRAWSEVDGLTGLANRRAYDAAASRQLTRSHQTGRELSLLVFDIDHFKRFNDLYGHLVGDDALRVVAETLRGHARRSDLVARYGGEEFVVLLPDTSLEAALAVAEKLRAEVRSRSANLPEPLTMCAGVASTRNSAMDAETLFARADAALYRAKRSGRDRAEAASSHRDAPADSV